MRIVGGEGGLDDFFGGRRISINGTTSKNRTGGKEVDTWALSLIEWIYEYV